MKYISKPVEVEAIQYTGIDDNVDILVSMIGDKRNIKSYVGMVPGPNRGLQMALALETVSDRYVLGFGDWLVQDPHGGIEVWTNEAFEERFEIDQSNG